MNKQIMIVAGAMMLAASSASAASSGDHMPSGANCIKTSLLPAGYLHTAGSQVLDEKDRPVRIASVGWNQGFERPDAQMPKIVAAGFNTVRISWVNATMRSDLETIDRIVAAATVNRAKVIIDHHTNEAGTAADGYGAQQKNGLWYDSGPGTDGTNGAGVRGTVTQAKFLSDWVEVARRYADNPTVIGFDLDNEPFLIPGGSAWGGGGARDIRLMYQTVGNAILAVNPGALIIAEGPQNYPGGAPWGDLSKAGSLPVQLSVAGKLVYSVHDYPAYVSDVRLESGAGKVAAMNRAWGYLVTENIAPVWIGEMGANFDGSYAGESIARSNAWAATLIDYLNGKLGAQGGPTLSGAQQAIGTDWWAWGYLPRQQLDGTLGADGMPRQVQMAVYSRLAQRLICSPESPDPVRAAMSDQTPGVATR